jgi:hypothetical protein
MYASRKKKWIISKEQRTIEIIYTQISSPKKVNLVIYGTSTHLETLEKKFLLPTSHLLLVVELMLNVSYFKQLSKRWIH